MADVKRLVLGIDAQLAYDFVYTLDGFLFAALLSLDDKMSVKVEIEYRPDVQRVGYDLLTFSSCIWHSSALLPQSRRSAARMASIP